MTQFEIGRAVEKISEHCLILTPCPFSITAFPTDNGAETINHRVAKPLIELTQSPNPPLP